MRDSFVFYRSFFEAAEELDDNDKLKFFEAICDYALNGDEIALSGAVKGMFKLLKPQLDANAARYENGKKGGRPKAQTETKKKPNHNLDKTKPKPNHNLGETKPEPNVNVNVNDNVNVNENENVNENASGSGTNRDGSLADAVSSLISYLNQKTGGRHKPTEKLRERIGVLLEAGYTEEDMVGVIDKKVDEWSDVPKMRAYLRPSTLFGDKFERYAAEPVSVQEEKRIHKDEEVAELQQERDDRVEELRDVEEKMELIRGKPDGIRGDPDGYGALKEQKIVIEQRLEAIDRRLERMQ